VAVPSSGELSLLKIRRELGGNYNSSTSHSDVSLKECSDGTVATINTQNASADRPDGSAPHAITEFYAYDHSLSGLETITNKFSFSLDGIDEYLDLGEEYHQIGSGNCTIMAWINTSSVASGNVDIFSIGANGGSRFRMQRRGNKVGAYIESDSHSGGAALTGSTTIAANTWYHVALVKSSTTFTIYLNGSSDGSITQSGTFNSQEGIIGAYFGGGSNFFGGKIDEAALFNSALSSNVISSINNATGSLVTADLESLSTAPLAWYRMGD
jgi:hypothetical protein